MLCILPFSPEETFLELALNLENLDCESAFHTSLHGSLPFTSVP